MKNEKSVFFLSVYFCIIILCVSLESKFANAIPLDNMMNGNNNNNLNRFQDGNIEEAKTIGSEISQMQQPILIDGGNLPPINVFHNPLWMDSNKSEDSDQTMSINKLNSLNAQLDSELNKYKQMISSGKFNNENSSNGGGFNNNNKNNSNNGMQNLRKINNTIDYPKFLQSNSESTLNLENKTNSNNSNNMSNTNNLRYNDFYSQNSSQIQEFPRIASLENKFLETKLNFLDNKDNNTPLCIRREGLLKIRDSDQKDKDVVVTYAVLTKDRLSYFVNAKDESSIQGSIELDKIKESLKLINGFASCFTVKTLDNVSDCSICAESEDSAREWINAITQNAVNCNTLSTLNNLNKRGLLK